MVSPLKVIRATASIFSTHPYCELFLVCLPPRRAEARMNFSAKNVRKARLLSPNFIFFERDPSLVIRPSGNRPVMTLLFLHGRCLLIDTLFAIIDTHLPATKAKRSCPTARSFSPPGGTRNALLTALWPSRSQSPCSCAAPSFHAE